MAAKKNRKKLGRGLSALISTPADFDDEPVPDGVAPEPAGARLIDLDPTAVKPNPHQPRVRFDEEALQDLADSIRRDGVQEPVIVRRRGDDYELVSGERRVRAAVMADLKTVPAICRDVSDGDMLKLGLIENIQREDLNAIETARAYQQLLDEFQWTQEELAEQVGKKRVSVTNCLRLLNLPVEVQRYVESGEISMGHARALLALDSARRQMDVCRRIVSEGLSVRQVEKMAAPQPKKAEKPRDPNIISVEEELRQRLATRVALKHSSAGKGRIEIEYFNLDELERILEILRS